MFFKNDRFFNGLRLVLALDPNRIAIGEVVIDAINNKYVPELEAKIEGEDDLGRLEELEALLEKWERYGSRRTSEGYSWSEEGAKVVKSVANKFGISDSQAEELALDVTSRFYTRSKLMNFILNYDYEKGPEGLMRMFKKAVGQEAITLMRQRLKELKQISLDSKSPYDDREYGQRIEDTSETDLDKSEIREVKREMDKYVLRNLKDDMAKAIYRLWRETAENKGAAGVNLKKDILENEKMMERGLKKGKLDRDMKIINGLIVRFLEDEEGVQLSKRLKKKLRVSNVASAFWRKMLASWVLELYRGRG